MNKYETYARRKYKSNKLLIIPNPTVNWMRYVVLAKEQDILYQAIHKRQDDKIFGRDDNE